mmetsp:Transcript_142828/g.202000  ORF Transcript_142828/g.202000 Transcript_142828/m.202000 type:complete len:106 (+) Transcript_142828:278-595(+)
MRNRIKKAIIMLKAASIFIKDHCDSIFISCVVFVPEVLCLAVVIAAFYGILEGNYAKNISDDTANALYAYLFFYLLWICEFFTTFLQLSLSIYICHWFFSYQKDG